MDCHGLLQGWVNQTILSLHAYTWTADHSRDNPKPALTDATEIHGHQPRAAPYPGSICPFFIVVISNNLHWLLTCCSSCGPILHHVFLCPDSQSPLDGRLDGEHRGPGHHPQKQQNESPVREEQGKGPRSLTVVCAGGGLQATDDTMSQCQNSSY